MGIYNTNCVLVVMSSLTLSFSVASASVESSVDVVTIETMCISLMDEMKKMNSVLLSEKRKNEELLDEIHFLNEGVSTYSSMVDKETARADSLTEKLRHEQEYSQELSARFQKLRVWVSNREAKHNLAIKTLTDKFLDERATIAQKHAEELVESKTRWATCEQELRFSREMYAVLSAAMSEIAAGGEPDINAKTFPCVTSYP